MVHNGSVCVGYNGSVQNRCKILLLVYSLKMTRNRKRKTDKGTFTEEMMRRAVNLVMAESVSIRQAAERSGIKFSTLQR